MITRWLLITLQGDGQMIDYKNHKPKANLKPVIEGLCFVCAVLLLAFTYLLIGA